MTVCADAFVFFGATGDLARREIFPALYTLVRSGALDVPILCVSRANWSLEQLIALARESVEAYGFEDTSAFERLAALMRYVPGDYREAATFDRVREALGDAKHPLAYLAVPPSLFPVVVDGLVRAGADKGGRVLVEKPFGRDLASARELNRLLRAHYEESDIFRIDHFLGEEALLNLHYLRFANSLLEPVWNERYVESIQLTMAESFGVLTRGKLYEELGALRDVVENHLLQALAVLLMDAPSGDGPEAFRDAIAHVLHAMRPLDPKRLVRGQYESYRREADVSPRSTVETYAALQLEIASWRWAGVPIFVRAGKKLATTATEVLVRFKRPPYDVFGEGHTRPGNSFRWRLYPHMAVALGLLVKQPGPGLHGHELEWLAIEQAPGRVPPYARLFHEALRGHPMLFARADVIEAQWGLVEPVLGLETPPHVYPDGSWGPTEADALVSARGGWHRPEPDPVDPNLPPAAFGPPSSEGQATPGAVHFLRDEPRAPKP